MIEIQKGDTVIHEGKEKKIDEIMGDVLILDDKTTVTQADVSPVVKKEAKQEEHAPVEEAVSDAERTTRTALRGAIESMTLSTPMSEVMNIMARVDESMVINTRVDWDLFKKDIIRRALELRKIDPKVCEHCNQIIPE